MFRRILLYLSLIVFFAGALFVMSMIPSQSESVDSAAAPTPTIQVLRRVQVYDVTPMPMLETILVPGTIEAFEDVTLGASIPGILENVMVKEGDHVKKGQVLFQIDLRSRESRLQQAQAEYELAKKTRARLEQVRTRGDATAQQYDEAVSREQQAEASVRMMQVDISLCKVVAPIDGIVDKVDVDEGEHMNEGHALARLLSMDKVKAEVAIPEKFADAVSRQNKAQVIIESLREVREADIDRVAYGADELTRTFKATLILDNADHRLRPGMIVQSRLVTRQSAEALMIPLFSLLKSETGLKVFVEKDGTVEERPVEIGAIEKDRVEIVKGLTAGEAIVVIGQKDLVNGQKVQVMDRIPGIEVPVTPEVKQ